MNLNGSILDPQPPITLERLYDQNTYRSRWQQNHTRFPCGKLCDRGPTASEIAVRGRRREGGTLAGLSRAPVGSFHPDLFKAGLKVALHQEVIS